MRTFTGTKEIKLTWTEEQLKQLLSEHGYSPALLTEERAQKLVEALIWNLEDDTDEESYNDSIRDLLADHFGDEEDDSWDDDGMDEGLEDSD